MLRQELQSYLDKVYTGSKIDTEHTLGGQVHIRFELGAKQPNGTTERVNEATDRALTLFYETFTNPDNEIWVLMYEPSGSNIFTETNDYLYQQFPAERFAEFYNELEIVNTRFFTTDENGNDVLDQDEERVVIGRLPVKEVNIENIIRGIANAEMGLEPEINQRVFFFDPFTDKGFQMYDDRGCYVWSDSADKIREIYLRRNTWIVDYHRPEIDEYFM